MTVSLLQPEERVLSTLNQDGSRRWLRPRCSPGRFLTARRWLGWALIGLFAALPYIQVNGKPAMLLDLPARRFTLLGNTLFAHDTVFLALLLVFIVVSIFLLTALVGRAWCGWACPQTVYLELVYRPLERFFDGPPGFHHAPGRRATPLRTALKYILFAAISLYLAHTFLAYFVGVESLLRWMQRSPFEHPVAFIVVAATTGLMLFNFAYFREQTCIVACPYGRLQSVLLDRHSLIISYDAARGEPRGKLQKSVAPGQSRHGDCIDCDMCVDTCPTGIDIRNGLQLECVACAQCVDACDAVMDKIGRPRGLVRFSSQATMAGEKGGLVRARTIAYPLVLGAIAVALVAVSIRKSTADVTILRGLGNPYTVTADGRVSNLVRIKVTNRTEQELPFAVSLADDTPGELVVSENPMRVGGSSTRLENLQIIVPRSAFTAGNHNIRLRVSSGEWARDVDYRLLGPPATAAHPATSAPAGTGARP